MRDFSAIAIQRPFAFGTLLRCMCGEELQAIDFKFVNPIGAYCYEYFIPYSVVVWLALNCGPLVVIVVQQLSAFLQG